MDPRFPEKSFMINWLKALLLSPGILFPAVYLLLYLSISISLNADFKKNLCRSFKSATGNTWQISIQSLKAGPALDSVTLDHIEIIKSPTERDKEKSAGRTVTIKNIEIPCPDLQKLLYSSTDRSAATDALCEKILAEEQLVQ